MTMLTEPQVPARVGAPRSLRLGAGCWVLTGTGHLLTDLVLRASPRPEDLALDEAMRAHSFDLGGLERSAYEVTMGFSLAMGACMVFVGILLLWVARLTAPQDTHAVALVGLAMSAVALAISAWLEPPPPIVLFAAACLAFGLALLTTERHPSPTRRPGGTS